ncbi:hypothetical protein [Vibrio taketomensis]|uniref:hypothetical protein n=1 Tax=Vibrio taketomensis TaxID=2572923 RepID=UPI0039EB2E6F
MFLPAAVNSLNQQANSEQIRQVIEQVLAQDPRPAYKKNKPDNKEYAVNLFNLNVKFTVNDNLVSVTAIERF